MDTHKCGLCSDLLSEGVHCTMCNHMLHFHCAGITEAGYRKLGEQRKLSWRCSKCKQTVNPPISPRSPRPESESPVLLEILAKLAPLEGMKEEISALRKEFGALKSSMTDQLNELVKEFKEKLNDMEQRIKQLEVVQGQVDLLQARIDQLEDDADRKDQWTRMNNIEVKGLAQINNENLFEIISKVGNKINYPVAKNQINFITRVPTREKDNTKPIIVSFCNRYVKEDFIAAARYALKNSPLTAGQFGLPGNQRIFINDHLTQKNKLLLSKTKKAAAEMDFRYVWVKHAKIHARKVDTSPVLLVKSDKDLAKIV